MATAVQIPLAEYLATNYEPDMEYVDGELVERNVGKWDHSRVQTLLVIMLSNAYEASLKVWPSTEWRFQVSPTRVRIPDVTLVYAGPQPDVLQDAPLLVIEVLSPGDSYATTKRKCAEYVALGMRTVWIVDPETRTAQVWRDGGWYEEDVLRVEGTPIELELRALWARLDGVR